MAKIEYKRSLRKIIIFALVSWALLLLSILLIHQYLYNHQTLLFVVATIFWGGFCFVMMRKVKAAECTSCQSDLFNVLDAAENSNLEVKYCPVCGSQLNR